MDVFKFVFDVAKDQSSNTPNCADLISQKTLKLDSLQFSNDELLFLDIFPNYENNLVVEGVGLFNPRGSGERQGGGGA